MQEENGNLLSKRELTDDEAGQAAGGSGQFTLDTYLHKVTHYCNAAPDNDTFQSYYLQITLNCPHYQYNGGNVNSASTLCEVCGHHSSSTSGGLL